jgi:type IV/VI secretion system ImpK/VasF family protein
MRAEIAEKVYPVFSYALALKDRLKAKETLNIANEQAALQGLLAKVPATAGPWAALPANPLSSAVASAAGPADILGGRYALVCWLDEIFCESDSPWRDQWPHLTLEQRLFGTRERATKFWAQAELADARPGADGTEVLEIYYLCAMLGFRGKYRPAPADLRALLTRFEERIGEGQAEWQGPRDLGAASDVPPLTGRAALHRMLVTAWIALCIFLLGATFFLLNRSL